MALKIASVLMYLNKIWEGDLGVGVLHNLVVEPLSAQYIIVGKSRWEHETNLSQNASNLVE